MNSFLFAWTEVSDLPYCGNLISAPLGDAIQRLIFIYFQINPSLASDFSFFLSPGRHSGFNTVVVISLTEVPPVIAGPSGEIFLFLPARTIIPPPFAAAQVQDKFSFLLPKSFSFPPKPPHLVSSSLRTSLLPAFEVLSFPSHDFDTCVSPTRSVSKVLFSQEDGINIVDHPQPLVLIAA